jgi:WD40 repeat protein
VSTPVSPYKGLSAFDDSELDALLFFGRERETEIVVANLIAARLTVLYGPSGVGKSSLLSAAVARSLRALPEEPLVVLFSRWSDDPASALAETIAEARGQAPEDVDALAALERAQSDRDVYLVLDQTEEYFLYHADDQGPGSFAEILPAILTAPTRVNVLVSLREDSLAKLDRFTGRIPGLFANTLRLDRLDRESARAAIVRPVERFAELTGEIVSVEPDLVERVLDEVGTGRIEPATGGRGTVGPAGDGARIEAPYLQLVMQRVWEEERAAGAAALRVETLDRLGGAQHIVEEHLEGAMDTLTQEEKDVASRLFNHLVTPSGTKIAHELSDLADFGQVTIEELRPVLATLTERRILRSLEEGAGTRYEIFHDVLGQPVLAWRARYRTEREIERQLAEAHRRRRRLQWLFAAVLVALALMGAVTVFALSQRSQAREQAREAKANELEALSAAELDRDPELSMLLALEAAKLTPTESAEEALREALLDSRVRAVVRVGKPLLDAVSRSRELLTATVDGDVVAAGVATGAIRTVARTGEPAVDASFADDGTALLTGRDGRVRVVHPDGAIEAVPGVVAARRAALSWDGSLAAVMQRDAVRLVEVGSGVVRQTYPHRGAISAAISSDNRRVLTGGVDGKVHVWSGQSGRRVHTLNEHSGHAVSVAFSRDGLYAASASTDGTGRVWSSGTWGLASVLSGHAIALTDVAFSTDGEHAVTASRDGTARVWKADDGTPLIVLSGHGDWVTSAVFSGPVGSSVITASLDGTARVWDALFQPELEELARLESPVTAIALPEEGQIEATTLDGQLHVLDATTGAELRVVPAAPSPRSVTGPDGTTATIRGNTVVLERNGETTVLEGHRARVTSVAFSHDGALLVTASIDHDARIWEVATGLGIHRLQHNSAVHDAQFSPDDRWVVTAANRVGLWDARTGNSIVRLRGHENTATAAAFDPTGHTLVTGGVDGTVRTYTCEVCGSLDELVALAGERLAATGRELTPEERERYLG